MEETERDPIMAELREIRAQVIAEVGNDPMAIMEYVKRKRAAAADNGRQPPSSEEASPIDEPSEP